MVVFTFVCRLSNGTWTATQHAGESNLEGSASSPFDLQRQLTKLALSTSSGPVSSSFSYVTPSSAVYQVIVGGGGGGAFFGGGVGAAAPSGGGAGDGAAPAAAEDEKEEKKEEEESDEDMGFSLFD